MNDRIAEVRVHELAAPLRERFGWSLSWTERRTATLIEVVTNSGLSGWGDGGIYDEHLLRTVVGRSPFEAEGIFEDMREPVRLQRRPGPQWTGGLDVALYDLAGRLLDKPVWQFLGRQYRTRVEPYCTALYRKDWTDPAEGLAREAVEWTKAGFRSLKMKTGYGPEIDIRIVEAVRIAVGPDFGLAVDSNCAYDAGTAVALARRFERFNLLWWEEPLLADDLEGYAHLKALSSIPIAAGETLPTDALVEHYIQKRLVDIVQPEIEFTGFTGGRRLSYLCRVNRLRLIPHNWGTAVRTAAILHWMSVMPPVTQALTPPPQLFELDSTEHPIRDAVVRRPFRVDPADGCIAVPDGPGLGIEIVREAVEEFRTGYRVVR